MYVESKAIGLEGEARIGRVYFSKTGKTLYYRGLQFRSLKGRGFKANYRELTSRDEYWIRGRVAIAMIGSTVEVEELKLTTTFALSINRTCVASNIRFERSRVVSSVREGGSVFEIKCLRFKSTQIRVAQSQR